MGARAVMRIAVGRARPPFPPNEPGPRQRRNYWGPQFARPPFYCSLARAVDQSDGGPHQKEKRPAQATERFYLFPNGWR